MYSAITPSLANRCFASSKLTLLVFFLTEIEARQNKPLTVYELSVLAARQQIHARKSTGAFRSVSCSEPMILPTVPAECLRLPLAGTGLSGIAD